MSTLGGLLLPHFQPVDAGRAMTQGIHAAGGILGNETALLALQDAKRQQAAQAQVQAYLAQHPETLLGAPGGQSLLGQMAPGSAPMMQQRAMPGQPPGAPAVVPGGQDLSRFAGGGGTPPPGMPTGGQGNPMEALLRQNPDAALQVLDLQAKRQTQQLTLKARIAAYVGSVLQGVRDQASYEDALQEVARVAPEWAKALPPTYSAEAVRPYIARANSVKEEQTLQVDAVQADTERLKVETARRQQAMQPTYTGDKELDAAITATHPHGVPPDGLSAAIQKGKQYLQDFAVQGKVREDEALLPGKIAVSAATGSGQIVQTEQGIVRLNPRTGAVDPVQGPGGGPLYPKPSEAEQRAASFAERGQAALKIAEDLERKGLQPSVWAKAAQGILPFGTSNYLISEDRQKYEQAVRQFAQVVLRKESGAVINKDEYEMTDTTYFAQPGNTQEMIAQKRAARKEIIRTFQAESRQTGRAQERGNTPPSSGGKFLSEAHIFTTMQASGKSRQEVLDAAKAKGYSLR